MCFKKKAILLIHGFAGGVYDFGKLPRELEVKTNVDVFSFTLPGHDMMFINSVKYTEWINSAKEEMDFLIENGYNEIYVIGHSMGGVIASYIASIYPEVKKLVLATPAFGYFSFKKGELNIKDFNDSVKNIGKSLGGYNKEDMIGRMLKSPIGTSLEFTKLVKEYKNSIRKVDANTLILHGDDDRVVPKEATDQLYQVCKSKYLLLYNIKNVNHDCFRGKRSEEVNDIIIDFINKKNKKRATYNI